MFNEPTVLIQGVGGQVPSNLLVHVGLMSRRPSTLLEWNPSAAQVEQKLYSFLHGPLIWWETNISEKQGVCPLLPT